MCVCVCVCVCVCTYVVRLDGEGLVCLLLAGLRDGGASTRHHGSNGCVRGCMGVKQAC